MINYINDLKTKPEHIRKRHAFLISFGFTFLILAGWIASYGFKPSAVIAVKKESNKVVTDTPISSLRATAIGAWSDIKNIVFGSNKVEITNDDVEVTAGKR